MELGTLMWNWRQCRMIKNWIYLITSSFQPRMNTHFSQDFYWKTFSSSEFLDWVISVHVSSVALLMSDSCDPMDCSPPLSPVHGISQVRKYHTGVGSHALLQRIFLTQESNLCLLHCRCIYFPSHLGNSSYL